ncbi:MAG: GNAT family N-acetyltransferase [Flavobacteriaceae bacterium]|nr:GNAT family N-acetyltransferase [Flavobacteriaceae bacterium]
MVTIKLFKQDYQEAIDDMLMQISLEFESTIFNNNNAVGNSILSKYWVAFYDKELAGTIAILNLDDDTSILKNMFVKKKFRGKTFDISYNLLQTAISSCRSENISNLYLGTMEQFIAAHKFYEKNGFQKIEEHELPSGFVYNPIDTVFYKKSVHCTKLGNGHLVTNQKVNQ